MTLSKLFDALIDLGLGVGFGEADGLAEVGVGVGVADAEVALAAGSSLPHPDRSSSDAAIPRTIAALSGEERTGEGYRVNP